MSDISGMSGIFGISGISGISYISGMSGIFGISGISDVCGITTVHNASENSAKNHNVPCTFSLCNWFNMGQISMTKNFQF